MFKECKICHTITDEDEKRCPKCFSPLEGEKVSLEEVKNLVLVQKKKIVFTKHSIKK